MQMKYEDNEENNYKKQRRKENDWGNSRRR